MFELHFHTLSGEHVRSLYKNYDSHIQKAETEYLAICSSLSQAATPSFQKIDTLKNRKELHTRIRNLVERRRFEIIGENGLEASCCLSVYCKIDGSKIIEEERTYANLRLYVGSLDSYLASETFVDIGRSLSFVSGATFSDGSSISPYSFP
ncbi:MAG TPA: hypothetical protein HA360_04575 [Nanoarchaeota archaeon]|nr:hypothetical protein [Candidatus Woesearchaeota archaeon]HIH15149.1 hypothetical protein [Nanoarchaeota archaeon]HIH59415.1 hypothetical protein [Nanoarchaeota archaeon]HII14320.1 hypothetical protein [Nanoarchaeota archaeon]HIJ04593.1 hypothetical protein [Nanoarchaeota archaeon]